MRRPRSARLLRSTACPPAEAALAHGLTTGESIVEAGERLGLTAETARNYSKRIYGKTGTTGQVDLVRLILSGLVPLS